MWTHGRTDARARNTGSPLQSSRVAIIHRKIKAASGSLLFVAILTDCQYVLIIETRRDAPTRRHSQMSAAKLIALAASKGYLVGRERRGVYYYGKPGNIWSFVGNWRDFVELVKRLPA